MTVTVPITGASPFVNFRMTKQTDGTLLLERLQAGRTPPPPETTGIVAEADVAALKEFLNANY